ncbi:MAG: hypothetical protein GYA32_13360 [Serratia sp.]|nr:hypothetical protein [Serratia sp. (in: enterobacteria)]
MTDTTDTAALREACGILNDHGYLTKSGKIRSSNLAEAVRMIIEQSVGYAEQLEAERQRADEYRDCIRVLADQLSVNALPQEVIEAVAAMKAQLVNPVVLPAGYSTRNGHPFNEGERNVMIPNKHGDWLSRFDVEHAIHVAGFTVKGE